MSILAKLFKKPSPPSLEEQLIAIKSYEQAQLVETAINSDQDALKLAALERLNDASVLVQVSLSDQKTFSSAARKRLGELLDDGTLELDAIRNKVSDDSALLLLCAYSNTVTPKLVATLEDEQTLAELASEGATTQVRQAAAEKIHSYEALTSLQKQLKGKDKTVYRIVKTKLAAFKAEQQAHQEKLEVLRSICVQAETLAKRPIDDIFHARRSQIEAAWANASKNTDTRAAQTEVIRYKQAMQKCDAELTAIDEQAKAKQATADADKAAKKELYAALGNLESLVAELFTHATPGELAGVIGEAETKADTSIEEAQQRGLTVAAEKNTLSQLRARSHAILETLEGHGSFPALVLALNETTQEQTPTYKTALSSLLKHAKTHLDHQPEWLSQAEQRFSQWLEDSRLHRTQQKAKIDKAFDLLRKGRIAIDKGQSGRVKAIHRDLNNTLEKIDSIPGTLQEKVDDFDIHMGKLGDWHEFAVTPKKEQLIKDMQALVDSTLPPGDLANKIKSLQAQWKTLAKGGIHQDDALWQQFQEASDLAYQPCKTYFDQEHEQRAANLQSREQLITQMQTYVKEYDWDKANWDEVETLLKTAREAWQSYWPIPRKETERVQSAFDTVMDQIYGYLNTYYEQNKNKKSLLIDQAEKLSELSDTQNAIEKAKLLQAQWQQIGRCKRKDDQVLWKAFRKGCDVLFEKRQQDYDAQKTKRNEALQEAQQIIEKIQAITALEREAFFAERSEVAQLSEQFQALSELPRGQADKIKQHYQRALKQVDIKADTFVREQEQSMWLDIFHYLDALLESSTPSEDIPSKCPAKIREALQKRAEGPAEDDNERALRILSIDAELRHDIDVPAPEKSLKMAMQVEQLQKNPGQRPTASAEAMKDQVAAWVYHADIEVPQYRSLETRFRTAWGLLST